MSLDLIIIIIYLILLLGMMTVLFWLLIFIKGTFFFSKRIITDTATDRTISIIGILFLLMLWGIYRWWSGKMSWETIEKSWSIEALDNLSQVKGKGSGFMRFVVKIFGKRNAYNGSIVFIFIFPLACFVL